MEAAQRERHRDQRGPHHRPDGALRLRWYSLLFTAAGVWLGVREATRKGSNLEQAQTLAIWAMVGGLVGARLLHVIDRWDLYAANPISALNVTQGGLAVEGGLVVGILVALVYAGRTGLPVRRLAHAAAPGMILGQALGRFACIPNGDAYRAPAHVPWAFIYANPHAFLPSALLGVPTRTRCTSCWSTSPC